MNHSILDTLLFIRCVKLQLDLSQSLTCSHSLDLLIFFPIVCTVSVSIWHLELEFDQSKQIKLVFAFRMGSAPQFILVTWHYKGIFMSDLNL